MKTRIRLLALMIRALLWSKPGTGTLNGRPESSLDERVRFNRFVAQLVARLAFVLLCLVFGVGLDEVTLRQVLLIP